MNPRKLNRLNQTTHVTPRCCGVRWICWWRLWMGLERWRRRRRSDGGCLGALAASASKRWRSRPRCWWSRRRSAGGVCVRGLTASASVLAGQKMAGTFPYWVAMWGECVCLDLSARTSLLIGSAAQRDNEPDQPRPTESSTKKAYRTPRIVLLVYCSTTARIVVKYFESECSS